MLNLDTHIFLHALAGKLRPKEKRLLQSSPWGISTIVLWEIAKLIELRRISLDTSTAAFRRALREVTVWPVTWDIAQRSTKMDISSDPADELIGATSIVHTVPLVTRDTVLLRSKEIPFPR